MVHQWQWNSRGERTSSCRRGIALRVLARCTPSGWLRARAGAVGLLACVALLAACYPGNNGGGWGPGSSQGDTTSRDLHARGGIVVGIFPELAPVMQALVPVWTRTHPGAPIAFSIAPTVNTVINQNTYVSIDVLITDVEDLQNEAASQGIILGKGTPFTATTLDFVVPASNPGGITQLQDTAKPGLHLVNIAYYSGVAIFTQVTLEKMMRDPAFSGSNIACATNYANCTYANMSVTVANGLDAGRLLVNQNLNTEPISSDQKPLSGAFIYHTDYLQVERELGTGTLTPFPIPSNFAPPHAIWAAVGAHEAVNQNVAKAFQSFLLSPEAQVVLRSFGYLPPSAASPATT